MLFRLQQNMLTGQGESITIDCCQWNPVTGEVSQDSVEDMQKAMQEMAAIADNRMYELNMRMLNVTRRVEGYFQPEVWAMVKQLLEVLAGRIDMETLLRRWDSTREENAELERGRLEAHQRLQQECGVPTQQWQFDGHEPTVIVTAQEDGSYTAPCGCHVTADGQVQICKRHQDDPSS